MGSSSSREVWTQPPPEYVPQYVSGGPGTHNFSAWAPDACKDPILSQKGTAAEAPRTVMQALETAVSKYGDRVALREEVFPLKPDSVGAFRSFTWKEYYNNVRVAAKALIRLGLQQFQAVNIIGFNSPEWFIADIAAIYAGGKAAGIYTTNAAPACQYIAEHSEARVAFVEDAAQLKKFLAIRDNLPLLAAIVVYREGTVIPADVNVEGKARVMTWKEFMALGDDSAAGAAAAGAAGAAPIVDLEKALQDRIAIQRPGHCCTLIYTSGTTGNPKAVMISHDNVTWTALATIRLLPSNPDAAEGEHMISYLPLSHIAAQMLDIHGAMAMCAEMNNCCVTFARPDALKGSLPLTLKAVRPTLFFGVPRVWEKIQEKMVALGKDIQGFQKSVAVWAKGLGTEKNNNLQVGGSADKPWFFGLAEALVFNKVKGKLGLDRCRMCLSGAAPIRKETVDYFAALDLVICEVYGMSENTGPQNMNRANYRKAGSCGPPLPGTEIKIVHEPSRDKPGNGEVCFRGRHIMMGYMKSEEKTRAAIDDEGWLHSEDVGTVDENGLLYITGRIKDLIIGAGGENIAPTPVQDAIKTKLPAISCVVMIGDKRKYNVALVTLPAKPTDDGGFSDELDGAARDISPGVTTVSAAMKDPVWQKYIYDGIAAANKQAVSHAATVQKFRIVPTDFSEKTGELTATLKVKRNYVEEKWAHLIDEMYNEPEGPAAAGAGASAAAAAAPAAAAGASAAPAASASASASASAGARPVVVEQNLPPVLG